MSIITTPLAWGDVARGKVEVEFSRPGAGDDGADAGEDEDGEEA